MFLHVFFSNREVSVGARCQASCHSDLGLRPRTKDIAVSRRQIVYKEFGLFFACLEHKMKTLPLYCLKCLLRWEIGTRVIIDCRSRN